MFNRTKADLRKIFDIRFVSISLVAFVIVRIAQEVTPGIQNLNPNYSWMLIFLPGVINFAADILIPEVYSHLKQDWYELDKEAHYHLTFWAVLILLDFKDFKELFKQVILPKKLISIWSPTE